MSEVDDGRFSWEALSTSRDPRYWELGWALHATQKQIIEGAVGIESRRQIGSWYAPLADLEVSRTSRDLEHLRADPSAYPGCRDIRRPADGHSPAFVPAGTVLELVVELPDPYYDGLGLNVWRTAGGEAYYTTALEGRYGCAASFTDMLIVPANAPVVRDPDARIALMAQLRDATIAVRRDQHLPPEGKDSDPRIRAIRHELAGLSDAQRLALAQAWDRAPLIGTDYQRATLAPEVRAVCDEASMSAARHHSDGTAPDPALRESTTGPAWVDPWPYESGGEAAACAIAVVLAPDSLRTMPGGDGAITDLWSRAWLEVFGHLPGRE